MKLRNTRAKQLVTTIFKDSPVPLLMTDVFKHVQKSFPTIAYSTIYRIVQHYHSAGQLVAIDWRERGSRYEWARKEHHHHLVCDVCGSVSDVDDSLLNFKVDSISKQTGFRVQDHSIELFGECSPCQRRS